MELIFFIESLIKKANSGGHYSTANAYASTLRSFQKFTGKESQLLEELTPEVIKTYEQHLFLKGLRHNTISLYMRMLRSICNQAVAQQVANLRTDELFGDVFVGYKTTIKRAIKPSIIGELVNVDLSRQPQLELSRDLFLLSFYLRGIPFVDLAYLRKSDVQNNIVTYYRKKTGQQLCVTLETYARTIIKRYAERCKDSPYLLPIITEVGLMGHKQYKSALRLYNKHLHRISERFNLGVTLTSYVARHTWATTARYKGIPVSLISTGMGHASEKVTYVYLDSFENKTLSDANKKVIAAIMKDKT